MKNVWGGYRNNWQVLVTCLLSSIIACTLIALPSYWIHGVVYTSCCECYTLLCPCLKGVLATCFDALLEIQTLCSLCSDFPGAPACLSAPSWSLSPDGTGAAKWHGLKPSTGWRVLRLIHHQLPVCACVHWNWVWTCHWIKQDYCGTVFFIWLVGFGLGGENPPP